MCALTKGGYGATGKGWSESCWRLPFPEQGAQPFFCPLSCGNTDQQEEKNCTEREEGDYLNSRACLTLLVCY